jgi:hypothetical protein
MLLRDLNLVATERNDVIEAAKKNSYARLFYKFTFGIHLILVDIFSPHEYTAKQLIYLKTFSRGFNNTLIPILVLFWQQEIVFILVIFSLTTLRFATKWYLFATEREQSLGFLVPIIYNAHANPIPFLTKFNNAHHHRLWMQKNGAY